jgi:hypothetical protein
VRQQLAAERIRLAGEILTDGNSHCASFEDRPGTAVSHDRASAGGLPSPARPRGAAADGRATAYTYLPRGADSSFRGPAR